jgi:hypothetical protein
MQLIVILFLFLIIIITIIPNLIRNQQLLTIIKNKFNYIFLENLNKILLKFKIRKNIRSLEK